ncbi:MAG: extracellular solute-binding protein [Hyphomicrobiales bacterium]|nr:extracellular solute-binding protein [Hyphomicrobiales bacterium]
MARSGAALAAWIVVGLLAIAAPAAGADPALVAAARKEGEVVWYTTQIVSQLVRPVAAAFEKKYPGIRVRATRANATETAVKILNEARAGRLQADVFDGTTTVVPLKAEGLVLRWLPDEAGRYDARVKDPQGYWIANNLFVITPGFNTSHILRGQEPRNYRDLLNPTLRGKMAWNGFPTSSGAGGFIGTVLTEMGEDQGLAFLRELAKQRIANLRGSAREVLDQVIAGEFSLALQIFNHHAVISAKKGAPVDWIPMQPATVALSTISVLAKAPHPNAAKLLMDFIISREGQEVFARADYIPAHPEVPATVPALKPEVGKFRAHFFTPEETEERMVAWKRVFDDLFR